jgi:hypothetical protein
MIARERANRADVLSPIITSFGYLSKTRKEVAP